MAARKGLRGAQFLLTACVALAALAMMRHSRVGFTRALLYGSLIALITVLGLFGDELLQTARSELRGLMLVSAATSACLISLSWHVRPRIRK